MKGYSATDYSRGYNAATRRFKEDRDRMQQEIAVLKNGVRMLAEMVLEERAEGWRPANGSATKDEGPT